MEPTAHLGKRVYLPCSEDFTNLPTLCSDCHLQWLKLNNTRVSHLRIPPQGSFPIVFVYEFTAPKSEAAQDKGQRIIDILGERLYQYYGMSVPYFGGQSRVQHTRQPRRYLLMVLVDMPWRPVLDDQFETFFGLPESEKVDKSFLRYYDEHLYLERMVRLEEILKADTAFLPHDVRGL